MKRCILVNSRVNKDEKTGDDLMFLTMYRLPSKMKNGALWNPKKDEALVVGCINRTNKPEEFAKFEHIYPGSLIDVTFGVNDFNNKTFVAAMDLVIGTNTNTPDKLYL